MTETATLTRKVSGYMDHVLGVTTEDKLLMKKAYTNYWNANWNDYKQKYRKKDNRYAASKLVKSWKELSYSQKQSWSENEYKNTNDT